MEKLIHDDCMNVLKEMKDNSVDLTVTDIPYGEVNRDSNGLRKLDKGTADITTFDLKEFVDELCRVTKGSIYIFCGQLQLSPILIYMRENNISTRQCIWIKTNPSPMNGKHIFLSAIENIASGKKHGATFNGFCEKPIWECSNGSSKIHPTEKPLELIEKIINMSSNKGDVVFDPCMGSGTTVIAAHRLGRKAIGVELDDKWFKVAEERWQKEIAQMSFFDLNE